MTQMLLCICAPAHITHIHQVGITAKAVGSSVPRCTAADPPPRRFPSKKKQQLLSLFIRQHNPISSIFRRQERAAQLAARCRQSSLRQWSELLQALANPQGFTCIRGGRCKLVHAGHRVTAALSLRRFPLIRLKDIGSPGADSSGLATHLNRCFLSFLLL